MGGGKRERKREKQEKSLINGVIIIISLEHNINHIKFVIIHIHKLLHFGHRKSVLSHLKVILFIKI